MGLVEATGGGAAIHGAGCWKGTKSLRDRWRSKTNEQPLFNCWRGASEDPPGVGRSANRPGRWQPAARLHTSEPCATDSGSGLDSHFQDYYVSTASALS